MQSSKYTYTATCLFGLESFLGEEISALGYERIETIDGRVTFLGDSAAAARCSIGLRFAERLYLNLGSFEAYTFTELFDGTKALPWEDFIEKNDMFPVKGHSIKSTLFSVPDCQSIIKKSVAERLGAHYGLGRMPETGVKYQIEFFILRDRASLMIDLSGVPLHKRGYRPVTVAAPLRETLAAALVKISRPREGVLLHDPFCGSGTIPIEGAMMMMNISPGAARSHAAEEMGVFAGEAWKAAREEASDLVRCDIGFSAFGSDIDPKCVEIANAAARRAGVGGVVRFECGDALSITTGGVRGTIVTNPPYGERLLELSETEELYRRMGAHFKTLDRWQMYILTSHSDFQRLFGKRADKVRKLYNGMIPCFLYQYFKNNSSK